MQNAFRSRDRKHVELPKGLRLPLFVRDYLSWVDPYGVRVFLVFAAPGSKRLTGIAFRREQGEKLPAPRVCDWCLNYGASDQVGMLTTDVDSKRRVGVMLCLDLKCSERLETAANLAGKSVVDDSKRLMERMARFAREGLGLEVDSDQ